MINVIAAFIFLFIAAILLAQFSLRYIYDYQISNTGIEIVVFGKIPIKRATYSNIVELRKVSFRETLPFNSIEMFFALRFGNRVQGQGVLIRQKKGLIKTILISPDNADGFIAAVQQHIQEKQTTSSPMRE